jgi:hypothetical protein
VYSRYNYLQNLKLRRSRKLQKANIVFAQVLGWTLSLLAGFRYFILLEDAWLLPLMIGNALLLIGVVAPDMVQGLRAKLEHIGSNVSTFLLQALLALVYCFVVCPAGMLIQSRRGRAPFYSWEAASPPLDSELEGWTPKKCSDERHLLLSKNRLGSNHIVQLFSYLFSNGDLLIMPSLLVIICLGLVSIFIQSTPLAPMIYTLF